MSRPKLYNQTVNVRLSPEQWMIVSYLAWKYRKPRFEILQSMAAAYIKHSKSFDVDDFSRWIDKKPSWWNPADDTDDSRTVLKAAGLEYAERLKKKGGGGQKKAKKR